MSIIERSDPGNPLNPFERVGVQAIEMPWFRDLLARERNTTKNILIKGPHALGDNICAEPAIRYMAKHFVGCDVSLITPFPELFRHIQLKRVFNWNLEKPEDWDKYHVFECYHAADAFHSQFVHNFNMSIDDYIAVAMLKGQLPVLDRNITLKPSRLECASIPPQTVVIHPGKHWVSKTFPKWWWDEIILGLKAEGITPAIIGADLEDGKRGTVDVNIEGCLDLRNKLTVMQSVSVLQQAEVVLTNDSAPYHMACSTDGSPGVRIPWVAVFSTVRHFDFIGHWRLIGGYEGVPPHNRWSYKCENLAKGTMWKEYDVSPAINGRKYDVIDQKTLTSWLPEPGTVVAWALEKLKLQLGCSQVARQHTVNVPIGGSIPSSPANEYPNPSDIVARAHYQNSLVLNNGRTQD